jgi:pimeloyl-ACP methyl ester carboxylesterase
MTTHLHVDVDGPGPERPGGAAAPSGVTAPAILFTHGFSATSAMWAPQAERFSADHTVIRWDMRGHGDSEYPPDADAYSLELTLEDMAGLLDRVGADRAVLVGHSLGGYASLAFTLAHPERVSGLVLEDTGPGFRSDKARQGWNDYAEATAARLDQEGLSGLGSSEEVGVARHRDTSGLAHVARRVLTQRDAAVIDGLPTIGVPTLVIVGSEDTAFRAGSDYMATKIPGAKLVVVEGAGHAPNLTHPEVVNEALEVFLRQVGA